MEREDDAPDFVSPAHVLGSWRAMANLADGQQPLSGAAPIIRPVSVARGASLRAARLYNDQGGDGADLLVEFHPLPLDPANFNYVDFSAYTGIAFWARSAQPIDFLVAAKDDQIPLDNEQFWQAETDGKHPWFAARQAHSDRWQRYEIRFSQLKQGAIFGLGPTTSSLHTGAINSIHFLTGPGQPQELWIDDLVLTCDAGCGDPTPDGGVTPSDGPGQDGQSSSARSCTPGQDQTCNDNPAISSLHGMCNADAACTCMPAFAKNPGTGKCL
jgi:hypothetical protein